MAGIPELSNRECLTGSAYLHLRIRQRIQKIGILQINLVRSGKFTYAFRIGIQQIEDFRSNDYILRQTGNIKTEVSRRRNTSVRFLLRGRNILIFSGTLLSAGFALRRTTGLSGAAGA